MATHPEQHCIEARSARRQTDQCHSNLDWPFAEQDDRRGHDHAARLDGERERAGDRRRSVQHLRLGAWRIAPPPCVSD